MTPETRKTLLSLISEYGNSLNRIAGEKGLMKIIEARAEAECAVAARYFRVTATAHWRDQVQQVREDMEGQLALFESVRDAGSGEGGH